MTRALPFLFVLLVVAELPLTTRAQQRVDWQDLYRQAITHVQRREWKPAEAFKRLTGRPAKPESARI